MENKKGISGSTLKMIAIVTMVIDHIGAAVLATSDQSEGETVRSGSGGDKSSDSRKEKCRCNYAVAFSKWSTILDIHDHANDRTCGVSNLLLFVGGGISTYA